MKKQKTVPRRDQKHEPLVYNSAIKVSEEVV